MMAGAIAASAVHARGGDARVRDSVPGESEPGMDRPPLTQLEKYLLEQNQNALVNALSDARDIEARERLVSVESAIEAWNDQRERDLGRLLEAIGACDTKIDRRFPRWLLWAGVVAALSWVPLGVRAVIGIYEAGQQQGWW